MCGISKNRDSGSTISQAPYKVEWKRAFTVKIFGNGLFLRPGGMRGPISDFSHPQAPYGFMFFKSTMSCGHSARISLSYLKASAPLLTTKKAYDPASSPQFWASERRIGLEKNQRYPRWVAARHRRCEKHEAIGCLGMGKIGYWTLRSSRHSKKSISKKLTVNARSQLTLYGAWELLKH